MEKIPEVGQAGASYPQSIRAKENALMFVTIALIQVDILERLGDRLFLGFFEQLLEFCFEDF
jgi:hypothetical protein